MIVKAIIEQRNDDEYRNKYKDNMFIKTEYKSILFQRGFIGVYGWIDGYGFPPNKHLDIMIITESNYNLGESIEVKVIGVFIRNDEDHKIIGIESDRIEENWIELPIEEKEMIMNIYPNIREGEGWHGKEKAKEVIIRFKTKNEDKS